MLVGGDFVKKKRDNSSGFDLVGRSSIIIIIIIVQKEKKTVGTGDAMLGWGVVGDEIGKNGWEKKGKGTWILYLAKRPKRSKRREGRPERKKTVSWRRKVTTVASWNSVKLPVRPCAHC